jgi:hypothetical protein
MLPRPTGNLYALFFEQLAKTCNITASAAAIGVSRQHVHHLRRTKPQFAKDWDDAIQQATDALEAAARGRAIDGYQRPVYQRGELVGYEPCYSDALMITLLKAHRPEKFRDKGLELPPGSEIIISMKSGKDDDGKDTGIVDVTPGAPEKVESIID